MSNTHKVLTLQLRAAEVFENVFPVRRILVASQVRLQLTAEYLQGRALPNTVRADQSKHLTGSGHGQPMEFEAVGRVSVGDLCF